MCTNFHTIAFGSIALYGKKIFNFWWKWYYPGYSCLLYFCFLYSECIYDTSTETEGPYDHSICQSATLAGIYQIVLPQEQTWPLQSKVLGHWSSEQFLESWTGIGWQIAKFGHRNSWSSDLEYKLDETCAC